MDANSGEAGDLQAYVKLMTESQGTLRAFIVSLIPGSPDVADVLQETNAALWQKRNRFKLGTNFLAWAFQIARYEIHRQRERNKRVERLAFSDKLVDMLAEMGAPDEADEELMEALDDCICKLTDTQREIVFERYTPGRSLEQYAARIGRSAGSLPANPLLEGVSLKPLLENPAAAWNHVAISTLEQNNHAVRDERWRYIRYADGSEELYDHQNDPNEWHNLAAGTLDPTQAAAITSLRSRLPTTNVVQRGDELPANSIITGGFETGNLSGWTQSGSGTTVSGTSPLAGAYSALQAPSVGSQLSQTFPAVTTAVTTSFVFSATDPGNDRTRSMSVAWHGSGYTTGAPQINLRLTDVDSDGDGDIQVFDSTTWRTVLSSVVTFDASPSPPSTTLTLTINSFGTGANYDVSVGSGSVTGLTHFQGGVPSDLTQLSFVNSSNTSGSSFKFDDVSVTPVTANGLEAWFGTHPGEFNAGITGLTQNGQVVTFTHPQNAVRPSDVIGFYQWSPNLADWYAGDGVAGPPGGPTLTITTESRGPTTTVAAISPVPIGRVFLRAGVSAGTPH